MKTYYQPSVQAEPIQMTSLMVGSPDLTISGQEIPEGGGGD